MSIRLLLAALLTGLLAPSVASAGSCTVNRPLLTCGQGGITFSQGIDWSFWGGTLGQLFDSETYDSCGGNADYDQPQDVWTFVCPPGGVAEVDLYNFSNDCNIDAFLLQNNCGTGDCVQGSAHSGTASEALHWKCNSNEIYYIAFERVKEDWGWVPFTNCNNYQDFSYSFNFRCREGTIEDISRCDDLIDNDQDTLVDCLDDDCPVCQEKCDDGKDNDFDSQIDCADIDCQGSDACCDRDHDDYMSNSGICIGDDCNDNPNTGGAQINPGAHEKVADGIDQDCDGRELCYVDQDGDHWGIEALVKSTNVTCLGPGVANKDPAFPDCNDLDPNINPSTAEIPADGIDGDCDGMEDCYEDKDADGYGWPVIKKTGDLTCTAPGVSKNALDCDDNNYFAHPGLTEIPIDGVDEDCDGKEVCFEDLDADSYGNPNKTTNTPFITCRAPGVAIDNTDCNDTPGVGAAIHPGATETVADGIDSNCDTLELCYFDNDMDTFGNSDGRTTTAPDLTCTSTALHASKNKLDCNDQDGTVYPGAPDAAGDGVDQNCDGLQDCYKDLDGDGWGGPTMQASAAPNCLAPGISPKTGDCNDTPGPGVAINPDAQDKVSDGVDQNCDGYEVCYADLDGDHFGRNATTTSTSLACAAGGVATNNLDCNDEPAPGRGATMYPGAPEIPLDGFDEDCNNAEICWKDGDADGYGSTTQIESQAIACDAVGVSTNALDCKDTDARIHPNATEVVADGTDQDCDLNELCYLDNDHDTYGQINTQPSTTLTCTATGFAKNKDDCDDGNALVYPGAPIPPGGSGGIDYACAGFITCYQDQDGDGYGTGVTVPSIDRNCAQLGQSKYSSDCNDNNPSVHPGVTEQAATLGDQDCDGFELCYQDLDDDGFGGLDGGGQPITQFASDTTCNGAFLSTNALDCNDFDPTTNPSAPELVADGSDNNCDTLEICYVDVDHDGYGNPTVYTQPQADLDCRATPSTGYADNGLDCNDTLSDVHPNAAEIPVNGRDEDCDLADLCYQDVDRDTYGNDAVTVPSTGGLSCNAPGVAARGGDCLDRLPDGANVYPGAVEIPGDGLDENCDTKELCYLDADRDKYGNVTTQPSSNWQCDTPGQAKVTGDCNDLLATVNPGATELPADGTDTNCDGREDCWIDRDHDDYGDPVVKEPSTDLTCLGLGVSGQDVSNRNTDCYDLDSKIHPGAPELAGDGLDEDCDGKEACYVDIDADHHGINVIAPSTTLDCSAPRVAPVADDCNDADSAIFPTAVDVPVDGVDQDCDGKENCWTDLDLDHYGRAAITASSDLTCNATGVAPNDDDCNDTVPDGTAIHPGATEILGDGVDQDCDTRELCYTDADGDHFGTSTPKASASFGCDTAGSAPVSGDCRDNDAQVYPGRTDVPANGIDDNCDGLEECWLDVDRDTYGGQRTVTSSDLLCTASGEAAQGGDCLDFGTTDGGAGIVNAIDVHPTAPELCNAVDDDCDTLVDDDDPDSASSTTWYPDRDRDRFGVTANGIVACASPGAEWVTVGFDCNDVNPAINPAADEVCDPDNIDENCNGLADDLDVDAQGHHLAVGTVTVHPDADHDGYGDFNSMTQVETCDPPPGLLVDGTDCVDTDGQINPSKVEIPYDGKNNDCDGATKDDDLDGDGSFKLTGAQRDCNDNPGIGATIEPGATEVANGYDDDCDGKVDEGTDWGDDDGDGFSEAGGDCNDRDKKIHPGASESLNSLDDDCDGDVDEGTTRIDDDHDGFSEAQGDCNDYDPSIMPRPGVVESCPSPSPICNDGIDNDCDHSVDGGAYDPDGDGYTEVGGDCDESNAAIHPGTPEIANGKDDDCDGATDEDTVNSDDDGDGTSEIGGDCNDDVDTVHPGATEVPNGVDDDCDGDIDEDSANADDDHDGYAENQGDCDDTDADVHPGARETANGKDDDCDTHTDEDLDDVDHDGVTVADGDCNDDNGWAHPGADEVLDGIDNDCNGKVDDVPDTGIVCSDGSQPTSGCSRDKCADDAACSTSGDVADHVGMLITVLVGAGLRRRRGARAA